MDEAPTPKRPLEPDPGFGDPDDWGAEVTRRAKTPKQQHRAGSLDARLATAALPAGPRTLQEAFAWPTQKLELVCQDPERQHRLRALLAHGVFSCSDYSGLGGEREILTQLSTALDILKWPTPERFPRFTFTRACDISPLCQQSLLHLASVQDDSRSCVNMDILDRLPTTAREYLDCSMPEETASKEEKAEKYAAMAGWLMENRAWLFHEHSESPCLVHDKACLVHHDHGVAALPAMETPLRMSSAGNCCQGWSSAGGKHMFAHSSEVPHAVWLAERRVAAEAQLEDLFIEECTVLYPWQSKLRAPLQESHKVVRVVTGPERQGFPTSRPRSLTAGIALSSMLWVGPESDEEIQQEFSSIFDTTMELSGDVFFQASTLDTQEFLKKKLRDRSRLDLLKSKRRSKWDILRASLPPGAGARLDRYGERRSEFQGIGGAFLADVHQWPGVKWGMGGPLFPCQLTHGDVVSWECQRQALGLEHMFAQGFHVYETGTPFESPLTSFLRDLTDTQVKRLSGNGWCLPCVAAWMVYVWSNCVRRPTADLGHELRPALGDDGESADGTGDEAECV